MDRSVLESTVSLAAWPSHVLAMTGDPHERTPFELALAWLDTITQRNDRTEDRVATVEDRLGIRLRDTDRPKTEAPRTDEPGN